MSGITKLWGLLAAAVAIGALAQRLQADEVAPAPRATATLTIDGMT